jgi:hypothetical protein
MKLKHSSGGSILLPTAAQSRQLLRLNLPESRLIGDTVRGRTTVANPSQRIETQRNSPTPNSINPSIVFSGDLRLTLLNLL